jgi:hypothetical protein
MSIASSSDGTTLYASAGSIYGSTDSGVHWTDLTSTAGAPSGGFLASSADGKHLAVAAMGGNISTGVLTSGWAWTTQTAAGTGNWSSIASSPDGTKVVAAAGIGSSGDIWTGTYTTGWAWNDCSAAGSRRWLGVAASSDGLKLVAVDGVGSGTGGYIWTSTDAGAHWASQAAPGAEYWLAVTSSSDGTELAAACGGGIWTSLDSGASWKNEFVGGSGNWSSVASSGDGTKLAAADYGGGASPSGSSGGDIWTGQ